MSYMDSWLFYCLVLLPCCTSFCVVVLTPSWLVVSSIFIPFFSVIDLLVLSCSGLSPYPFIPPMLLDISQPITTYHNISSPFCDMLWCFTACLHGVCLLNPRLGLLAEKGELEPQNSTPF